MQKLFLLLVLFIGLNACTFKFNDYDISPDVKTFSVEQFETTAGNAPPTIGQQFSEQLKQRILNDTKLQYRDSKGDIEFLGAITSYEISPIAPQPGQTVALQRLTLRMDIECKSSKQVIKNWSPSFSRFADFAADADLSAVEERLVKEIYTQIIEDVFNKAFSNW